MVEQPGLPMGVFFGISSVYRFLSGAMRQIRLCFKALTVRPLSAHRKSALFKLLTAALLIRHSVREQVSENVTEVFLRLARRRGLHKKKSMANHTSNFWPLDNADTESVIT